MATIVNTRDIALRATTPRISSNYPTPSDVTGVTNVIEQFGAKISWTPISDPNAIYVLKTGGSDWSTATEIYQGLTNSYLLSLTAPGSVVVRIKAYNKTSGLYSTNAVNTTVGTPVSPAPTVSHVIAGVNEKLSWTFASSFDFNLDHFEIRYGGTDWASATFLASTKSTYLERKVDYNGAKKYWVAGVDSANNLGIPTSIDVTVTALTSVTSTRADVVDNNALLYWTAPTGTLPIDRYEIRRGPSWAGYTSVVGSNSDSTFTTIFETQSGTYTYWVGAYDSAGILNTPVAITATINQPPDYVLRQNFQSTFANQTYVTTTATNMLLEAGVLIGPVNTTETWTTHYTGNSWTTPDAQIAAGYPLYIEPSLSSGSYEEVYDATSGIATTITSVVAASMDTTAIVGTVTKSCQISWKAVIGDSWTPLTAGITSALISGFRWIRVVWTFTGTAGAHLIRVNSMTTTISSKLKTDSGTFNITTASTGVVVNFNISFIDADTPICQANGLGADSKQLTPVVDFTDTANPTNFTVYLYNYSGAKVTGSGSWTARGY